MIQRYESVLQSLNYEFKSSLDRNQQLQQELQIMEQSQAQDRHTISELNTALYNNEASEEVQKLSNERIHLKIENEQLSNQILQLGIQLEEAKQTASSTLAGAQEKYKQSEHFFQARVDETIHKAREAQTLVREKEEANFELLRENEALQADIRNLEAVESSLKDEIDELVSKRKSLEDINQALKNQI